MRCSCLKCTPWLGQETEDRLQREHGLFLLSVYVWFFGGLFGVLGLLWVIAWLTGGVH